MLQPISPITNHKTNYNMSRISFKNAELPKTAEETADFARLRDTAIIDYLEKSQQREKQNQLFAGMLFTLSFIALPLLLLPKKGRRTKTDKDMLSTAFKSLRDDKSVPTLHTCNSIDKKLKELLQNQVELAKATREDLAKTGNPDASSRLILYGAPGSGKSFFAKIFAKTLDAEYKEIMYSDFNSRWAGEGVENLTAIFNDVIETAKKSPNKKFVVTFNEIDTMVQPAEKIAGGSKKGGGSYWITKLEERATFLNFIDRVSQETPNVTIIGTTNISPKNGGLDGAAMSRFKNLIEVAYPNKQCMLEALKEHILTLPEGKEFVSKNSQELEAFAQTLVERKASYRDLNNIVGNSKNYYLRDTIKNKESRFKIDYLEKARDAIDATDGEVSGLS